MSKYADEDMTTNQMPVTEWLEPVPNARSLPKVGVNEGAYCYVQENEDEATWQFRRGRWVRIARRAR